MYEFNKNLVKCYAFIMVYNDIIRIIGIKSIYIFIFYKFFNKKIGFSTQL